MSGRYPRLPRLASAHRAGRSGLCPEVSIEFDVGDAAGVGSAAEELMQSGFELLHPSRVEPWGQTVARLQSPEGAIVGISHIPMFHEEN